MSHIHTRNELSEINVGKNLRRIIGNDRIKNRLINERWLLMESKLCGFSYIKNHKCIEGRQVGRLLCPPSGHIGRLTENCLIENSSSQMLNVGLLKFTRTAVKRLIRGNFWTRVKQCGLLTHESWSWGTRQLPGQVLPSVLGTSPPVESSWDLSSRGRDLKQVARANSFSGATFMRVFKAHQEL